MKKIVLPMVCVFMFIVYGCSNSPVNNNPGTQTDSLKIDSLIEANMEKWDLPGLTFAIAYNGNLVYSKGYGYVDTLTKQPVTTNSLFRIASISKSVTAVAVMKLFQDGKLNLDAQVFGPSGILNEPYYQNILDSNVLDITVTNLLNHTGGWDDSFQGDPMFMSLQIAIAMGVTAPAFQQTTIEYVLANFKLINPPGTVYSYYNFGYCVLQEIIEKVSGQTYEDYLRQNVLIPSGSNDMQLGMNLESNRFPNEVTYYGTPGEETNLSVYGSGLQVPWPYGGFNMEEMDGNGRWIASAEDLVNFALAVKNNTILNQATYNIMVTVPNIPNTSYAKGWGVASDGVWNQGSQPGTVSEIQNATNGYSWALIVNKRSLNNDIYNDLSNIGWNVQQYIH